MPLNKSKGQMYPWVSHTINFIKGKCPHDCSYCYMRRYPQAELHFDAKELKTDLGEGNFIFVGSSCDMWASSIKDLWINEILLHCYDFDNRYLFQTKNPARFEGWKFPDKTILGITLESNRCWNGSKSPCPVERYFAFKDLPAQKMVSIEPIMDFDLDEIVSWMQEIKPEFVSIGADSQHHDLPEPSGEKVKALIEGLREFTEVEIKDNLSRILEGV